MPKRPTGFILAATMGLWGLSRFAEEHLWLSDTSHVGSFLVQAAGLALCAAGIITMAVLWRKSRNKPQTDASLHGPDTVGPDTVGPVTVSPVTVDRDESRTLHAGIGELETAGAIVEPSGPASPTG